MTFWLFAAACAVCTAGLVTFGLVSFHLVDARIVPAAGVPLLYATAMAAEAVAALVTGEAYDRRGPRIHGPAEADDLVFAGLPGGGCGAGEAGEGFGEVGNRPRASPIFSRR